MSNSDQDGTDPFGLRSTDGSILIDGAGLVNLRANPAVVGGRTFSGRASISTNTSSQVPVTIIDLPFTKTFEGPMLFFGAASASVNNTAGSLNDPSVTFFIELDGAPLDYGSIGYSPGNAATPTVVAISGGITIVHRAINVAVGVHHILIRWFVNAALLTATIDLATPNNFCSITAQEVV